MSISPLDILPVFVAPFVGSFLAALAYRLPRGLGFVRGRSRCDSCGAKLAIADLIPIVSWIWLRGRCRHCGQAIAIDNLLLELAALALAVWAAFVMQGWLLWVACALGWSLALCAAIDYRHLVVPDALSLPLLLAGLGVAAALAPGRLPVHAIGAIAGFAVFAAVAWSYRRLAGRDGLGLGDAKLLAALGAWVGWPGLTSVVLFAALSGIAATVAARRLKPATEPGAPIAFGPYLGLGGWLVWLYGPLEITF